jgi:mannose-6-phosphate isomerase-like protein (cupin superfamily)
MKSFETRMLPAASDVLAPDGSEVRILLALKGGSMAHFRLPAGKISRAVRHQTVEEIWYVVAGHGQMWRSGGGQDETVAVSPGLCLTIPVGTAFQFRAGTDAALEAVAITMPPWPGENEAVMAEGLWPPTV